MHKNLPNLFVFLDKHDNQIFQNNNTNIGIVYRNYNDANREIELAKIAKDCKKKRYKLFVSNNIKLALKVKADGIYIPAFNKNTRFINNEKKNLMVIGSAHNQKEIQQKISQKCSAIFLSPVFNVSKSKTFLDVYKFNYISRLNKTKIFALGGITENNIRKIKLLHTKGLGGIRLFKKKTGLKRPVFL